MESNYITNVKRRVSYMCSISVQHQNHEETYTKEEIYLSRSLVSSKYFALKVRVRKLMKMRKT